MPEAEGKAFDPHAGQSRHKEVTELMHKHHKAKHNEKRHGDMQSVRSKGENVFHYDFSFKR